MTTTRATNHCRCGNRISKYATTCRACDDVRRAQARALVARGHCPDCGAGLVRNSALAGWWQCGAYGRPDFRRPEYRTLPDCSFQTFTE